MAKEQKLELYKDLPGYANLSEEQKAVVTKWDEDRTLRDGLITKMLEAFKAGDKDLARAINEQISDTVSSHCEHERSIWKPCAACDEIEKILHGLNPDEDFPEENDEF